MSVCKKYALGSCWSVVEGFNDLPDISGGITFSPENPFNCRFELGKKHLHATTATNVWSAEKKVGAMARLAVMGDSAKRDLKSISSIIVISFALFSCSNALRLSGASGATWDFASGRWTKTPTAISQQDSTGIGLALNPKIEARYSASVEVRFSSTQAGQGAGLILQATDPQDYDAFLLERKKGGLYAVLKSVRSKQVTFIGNELVGDEAFSDVEPSQWQKLRAEVDGATIAGYLNGRQVVSFSFTGHPPKWYAEPAQWKVDLVQGEIGLYTEHVRAEFRDFKLGTRGPNPIYTASRPRLDYRGDVLPRQSYAKTFTNWDRWMAHAARYTDYRDAPELARKLPPYVLSSFVFSNDALGTDFQYPGHNHTAIINGFIQQYLFSGDRSYLAPAEELADWDIAHSTPAKWALANLPLSLFDYRKKLGSLEPVANSGFEPDKSAYLGRAYLELYGVTENKKYLDAAIHIADALQRLQRPDGSFPFRVQPKTGKVVAPYTCSVIWYVRFFEDLAYFTKNWGYRKVRDRAFEWMMENPVKTNDWQGLYGDIATGTKSYDQWIPLDTAMYLLDKRREDPSYTAVAQEIVKWVVSELGVEDGFYPGVPAVIEQSSYPVILSHHNIRLAEVYARLWGATGNPEYKHLAEQIANTVTWLEMSDGKMRFGLWWHADGCPFFSFAHQFLRIMSEIPETAPQDENHFIYHDGYLKDISYSPHRIVLDTWDLGESRFSLTRPPVAVRDDEGTLPELREINQASYGWTYDPGHHFLRVRSCGHKVIIDLGGAS